MIGDIPPLPLFGVALGSRCPRGPFCMRRIADGDLNVEIQDNRGDEIADMGRALVFFRQATADAATARRKESEQTRTLESRRQLVETATHEFERAVSDIAKTLDRAAAAMTGGKTTGIEVEASRTSMMRSRAFGLLLAAIAPMFQMTGRAWSRLVVKMNNSRPLPYSSPILRINSSSRYREIIARSGALFVRASPVRAPSSAFLSKTSLALVSVYTAFS